MIGRATAAIALCLAACVLAMALGGCGPMGLDFGKIPWTPRSKLAGARETFNMTVHTLAALRERGTFTRQEGAEIGLMIHAGQRVLDRWEAAIELGQSPAAVVREFAYVMRELTAARLAAERKVTSDEPRNGPTLDRGGDRTDDRHRETYRSRAAPPAGRRRLGRRAAGLARGNESGGQPLRCRGGPGLRRTA